MILGVSEWLSEKSNIDVSIIRVGFVIAVVAFGTGLGLYLILWLVKILSS